MRDNVKATSFSGALLLGTRLEKGGGTTGDYLCSGDLSSPVENAQHRLYLLRICLFLLGGFGGGRGGLCVTIPYLPTIFSRAPHYTPELQTRKHHRNFGHPRPSRHANPLG